MKMQTQWGAFPAFNGLGAPYWNLISEQAFMVLPGIQTK